MGGDASEHSEEESEQCPADGEDQTLAGRSGPLAIPPHSGSTVASGWVLVPHVSRGEAIWVPHPNLGAPSETAPQTCRATCS